ncbi:AfsR/SARP family transcriptional regulator [Nocardia sp. NPDC088792]|uniref:AfsR/SARP family transcriptional regulator n=1 Tax=Nocardia sp. NPDC088792 TaxID=3364332 RepID=UPI0037F17054
MDGTARLHVTLLGAFQVSCGDTALRVAGTRLQALVVRLALAGGRTVEQDALVDAIWPEHPPSGPAHALQTLVSRLRRTLGSADAVTQLGGGYRLAVHATDVDTLRFEHLATTGRDHLRARDPKAAAALLGEALTLWADRPGTEPTIVAAVAPAAATRLAHASIEAVTDLAEAELALGHADSAATRLTALLTEHPANERAAALLMDALAAQGREAEALTWYERVRETLADTLGADPGAALRQRHLRLLRADRQVMSGNGNAVDEPPRPSGGQAARHPTDAVCAPAGKTRTGSGDLPAPGNLPAPLTSFIGRDQDLDRIDTLLTAGRLITVVGPGGAGKTRLALEAAHRHRHEYPDGTWMIDLASVTEPAEIGATLLAAIGLRGSALFESPATRRGVLMNSGPHGSTLPEASAEPRESELPGTPPLLGGPALPGTSAGPRDPSSPGASAGVHNSVLPEVSAECGGSELAGSPAGSRGDSVGELEVLIEQLGAREMLLVVDNCEHLIDAVAQLLSGLLTRCAGVRVLATSREPLAVDGESLVPLGPLTLPEADTDVEEARRTASVRLFSERAAAVRPGFEVGERNLGAVVRIVRGLDGMPLALELAAARLRTLALGDLAAGLSDRFRLLGSGRRTSAPRHRTLRAVIAWSWDLLEADARTVAERVSVLPGGVTPGSAIAVCAGTGVPAGELPELLAGLVDRSLLQLAPESGRYRMLETIREYGLEQLAAQDLLPGVRGLAAHWSGELVARCDPMLRGPEQLGALHVLRAEYDNVLAGLRHLCDIGDSEGAVALAVNLTWYWQMLGRHGDAAFWLGEAVAVPVERTSVERDIAEGLLVFSSIATPSMLINDAFMARQEELRSLADRLSGYPELPGLGGALTAIRLASLEDSEASQLIVQRLVDGPDGWLAGLARMFRAEFAENAGHLEQVRGDVTAALECFDQAGDRWGLASALPLRAQLRQYDGDLEGAMADLEEANRLAREFGSLSLSDEIFIDLRWIDLHARLGETTRAIEMIAAIRERILRSAATEMAVFLDAREAGLWLRAGDPDRASARVEAAEAGLLAFGGNHGRALVGAVRGELYLALGDGPGAAEALSRAYAAAVESRDLPIVATVAVTVAGLAALYERFDDVAVLLGAAARLRGAHDHTDPQIRALSGRGRAALGTKRFDAAYDIGWRLDAPAAITRADPAELRRP